MCCIRRKNMACRPTQARNASEFESPSVRRSRFRFEALMSGVNGNCLAFASMRPTPACDGVHFSAHCHFYDSFHIPPPPIIYILLSLCQGGGELKGQKGTNAGPLIAFAVSPASDEYAQASASARDVSAIQPGAPNRLARCQRPWPSGRGRRSRPGPGRRR